MVAEENFPLDYWGVSHLALIRQALAEADTQQLLIDGERWGWKNEYIMTDDEKARVFWTNADNAEYVLQDTRGQLQDRTAPYGFEEYISITAYGMKISKLYRRIPDSATYDQNIWNKVVRFESSAGNDFTALSDNDTRSFWSTEKPKEPGDFITIEFSAPVDYDYIYMLSTQYLGDAPIEPVIYTSMDGVNWIPRPYAGHYRLEASPEPYLFLKIENGGSDGTTPWRVYEMGFGYSK